MKFKAKLFFAEAIAPVVERRRSAMRSTNGFKLKAQTLSRRALELGATHRRLQRDILQHKTAEAVLRKDSELHAKRLKVSLQLQDSLRQRTHRALAAQEEERKIFGRELQDEIVQTLLGINVRLIFLRQAARSRTKRLKNEITNILRLSSGSVECALEVAREYGQS